MEESVVIARQVDSRALFYPNPDSGPLSLPPRVPSGQAECAQFPKIPALACHPLCQLPCPARAALTNQKQCGIMAVLDLEQRDRD